MTSPMDSPIKGSSSSPSSSSSPTPAVASASLSYDDDDLTEEDFAFLETSVMKTRQKTQEEAAASASASASATSAQNDKKVSNAVGDVFSAEADEEETQKKTVNSTEAAAKRRRLRKSGANGGGVGRDGGALVDADSDGTELYEAEADEEGDEDDMGDFIEDDTNGAHLEEIDHEQRERSQLLNGLSVSPLQESFQPGSTPEFNKRRYLAFNTIGYIVSREENGNRLVEILFNDTTKYKAVRMKEFYHFHVAALGEHSAIFASRSRKLPPANTKEKKEETVPATIHCRPFDSWAVNSTWEMRLPAGEEVHCVAVGKTWAAAATSKDYLRIFSYSGVQRAVLSLPGPVLTAVGHQSLLFIVFHSGVPVDGVSTLRCWLLDVDHHRRIFEGSCPISKSSQLMWVGFSEFSMALTKDSNGVVRGLAKEWDFCWQTLMDVADVKKNRTDFYWPVGLLQADVLLDDRAAAKDVSKGVLVCAICRGGAKYPSAAAKPALSEVPLTMPFLDRANSNVALQEEFARAELLARDKWDVLSAAQRMKAQSSLDKLLAKPIATATAEDRLSRALDLFRLLRTPTVTQYLYQFAVQEKKEQLISRMQMIMKAAEKREEIKATKKSGSSGAGGKENQQNEWTGEEDDAMNVEAEKQSSSSSSSSAMDENDDGEAQAKFDGNNSNVKRKSFEANARKRKADEIPKHRPALANMNGKRK